MNKKLQSPELSHEVSPRRPVVTTMVNKYEMKVTDKAKAILGFGTVAISVKVTVTLPKPSEAKKPGLIGKGLEKIHHGMHDFLNDIKDRIMEQTLHNGFLSSFDAQRFARVMSCSDCHDHQTALNTQLLEINVRGDIND